MSEASVPAVQQNRPPRIITEDPIAVLDTGRFEQMQRIAQVMAGSSLIPESFYKEKDGNNTILLPERVVVANCFLVINQAVRWGMDPFGVIQCCSVINGRLMYEGKLVAGVLEARLGVTLDYKFGKWNPDTLSVDVLPIDQLPSDESLGVVVFGQREGDREPVTVDGTVGAWKTTRSQSPWSSPANWKRQLRYRGAREWARAHAPGVMLGVITDDELDEAADRRVTMAALPEPKTLAAAFGPPPKAIAAPKEDEQAPAAEAEAEAEKPADPEPEPEGKAEPEPEAKPEPKKAAPKAIPWPEAKPEPKKAAPKAIPWPDTQPGAAAWGEKYHLEGDPAGEDGKRNLYVDGNEYSRVGVKGGFPVFAAHPPAKITATDEGGLGGDKTVTVEAEVAAGEITVTDVVEEEAPAIRANPEDRRDPAQDEAEAEAEAEAEEAESEDGGDGGEIIDTQEPEGAKAVDPEVSRMLRAFAAQIKEAESWLQIKAAMRALQQNAAWAEKLDDGERRDVRLHAYNTANALVMAGKDPVSPSTDPSYFGLWLLSNPAPDVVKPTFMKLAQTKAYKDLPDPQRAALSSNAMKAAGEDV